MALEAECIALVTSLFRDKNVHPIKLYGKEIFPTIGTSSEYIEYYHNKDNDKHNITSMWPFPIPCGHTLSVTDDEQIYTSYTYINCVEMQEQKIIQNDMITAILINTFNYTGIRRSVPGHDSWQNDLWPLASFSCARATAASKRVSKLPTLSRPRPATVNVACHGRFLDLQRCTPTYPLAVPGLSGSRSSCRRASGPPALVPPASTAS